MRIIVDFEDPGDLSYSVYKFENYNGYPGSAYVVAAPIGSGKAYVGKECKKIDISNSIKLDLRKTTLHGLTKREIENLVRKELEIMESRHKTEPTRVTINNSGSMSMGVDPYKDPNQAQPKKFEDMSNGLDILDRAAKSQVKNWGDTSDSIPFHVNPFVLGDVVTQKESAIPTKLFTVSKPKQTKTIRKPIPMSTNLKFKK